MEQYERRQILEFRGVPKQDDEHTTKIVVQLADLLNVEIKESDVSTSH